MKKISVLATALIIATLASPAASAPEITRATTTATVPQKRQELRQVLAELTLQRRRLRQVKRQERRVLGELEGIDRTREQSERRLEALSVEIGRTQIRAQAVSTQLAVTERSLVMQRATLGRRLRDAYKYGQTGYVDVLLGADDFSELMTRWQFISTIVRADGRSMALFREDVARYERLRNTLLTEQAQLAALAWQTKARRKEIVAKEQQKRSMLAKLQEERASFERMVRELQANSRELESLIRRSQGVAPVRAGYVRALGRFLWPARGTFTSPFGIRRHPIFGIRRMHTGQDIAAPYRAPVIAAADGQVLYVGWFGGYGKIVVLDHGASVSTLYAHLSQILVNQGGAVRRGQQIGRVGSTGYSTGPHVHFEIRIAGRPIDPARR
jgi:murein DD-endopeptidase MepM/ murein hydrolase activator NlpD